MTTSTTITRSGARIATMLTVAEPASSAADTNGVPTPNVPALTIGRLSALVACTVPATATPTTAPTHGRSRHQPDCSTCSAPDAAANITPPVSYTHLTLPT